MQNNSNICEARDVLGNGNDDQQQQQQQQEKGIPNPLNVDAFPFQHRTYTPSFEDIAQDYGNGEFDNGSRQWKSPSNLNNFNAKGQHGHGIAREVDEMSSVSAFSVPGSLATSKWAKIFVNMLEDGKKPIIIDRHVEWSGRGRPILGEKLRGMVIDMDKWANCKIVVTLPNGDVHGAGLNDELILMATYKVTLSNGTEEEEEHVEDENEDKDRTLEEEHFEQRTSNGLEASQIDPEEFKGLVQKLKELELSMATIQQQQTDDFVHRLTNHGRLQVDADFRELALNGENMLDTIIRLQKLICNKGRVFDALYIPRRCQLPTLSPDEDHSIVEDVLFQPIVDHLLNTERPEDVIRNVRIELPEKWPMPSMGANGISARFKDSSDSERKLTYSIKNIADPYKIFKVTFFYDSETDKEETFKIFQMGEQAEEMKSTDQRLAFLEQSRELAKYAVELQEDSIASHHRAIVIRRPLLFFHTIGVKLMEFLFKGAIHCSYFEAFISTFNDELEHKYWEIFLANLVTWIQESNMSEEIVPKILLKLNPSDFSKYSIQKWPEDWMAKMKLDKKYITLEVSNEIDVAIKRCRFIISAKEGYKFELHIFPGYIYLKRIQMKYLVLEDEFPMPPVNVLPLAQEWTSSAKLTIEGGKWSVLLCQKNGPVDWAELLQFLQFGQHLCKEFSIRFCTACNPAYAIGQSMANNCWSCGPSLAMFNGRCSQCFKLRATCVNSFCPKEFFNELIMMASRYKKAADIFGCSNEKMPVLTKSGMKLAIDNEWNYILTSADKNQRSTMNQKVNIALEPKNKVDLWKRCSALSLSVNVVARCSRTTS